MKAIIASALLGVLMMFISITVKDKRTISIMGSFLLFLIFCVCGWEVLTHTADRPSPFFNEMIQVNRLNLWFNFLMAGAAWMFALLFGREMQRIGVHVAEYFALICFILTGVFILSSFQHLLLLFLGMEIMSIPQYILAGSDKKNLKSSEASLKYFLQGAFSTGIMLMGITLVYGASGSFYINSLSFLQADPINPLALTGILFLVLAFSFKVSAAPMHLWTPDVYDGAPTPFTALMSTIVKAGAFFGFLRLFGISFSQVSEHWAMVIALITVATMVVGNFTAVFQQSVKRMLAYSSIAQAGFMLLAILAFNAMAWMGLMIYALAYTLATMGAFAVLMKMKDYTYDGFIGLAKKEPFLAACMAIFMFSLTGIPLTGGFMGKYYMLWAVIETGQYFWLVIFALFMAAISVYYYFRVIIAMYFKSGETELASPVSAFDRFYLGATALLLLLMGTFPQLFLLEF